MLPKVSVIIPVYNTEKYLHKCLESVCNQTLKDLEIICVNDCSTDNSGEILKEFATKDSRFKLINNSINLKAGLSRNAGLKKATGEYVYFMDSDDYIDPDYLQQLYDKAVKHGSDITINVNVLTETFSKSAKYIHPAMPHIPDEGCFIDRADAIDRILCTVWMRLFKRKFLIDNNIFFDNLETTQDLIFSFITHSFVETVYAFSGSAYHYVIRNDSLQGIVNKVNKKDLNTMKAYDFIYEHLLEYKLLPNNTVKIFNVYPFFKVDTKEKFDFYKSYFEKIKEYLDAHQEQYNPMDLFFSKIILNSNNFDDYKSKYPQSVVMAFLKNSKKQ